MLAQAQTQGTPAVEQHGFNSQFAQQNSQIPVAPPAHGGTVQQISPSATPNVATTTILPPAGLGQPARQTGSNGYPPQATGQSAAPSSSASELQALKQERELVSKRFEQINSGNGGSAPQSMPVQSTPAPSSSSSMTAPSPPRYNPDAGLTPEQIRLRDSPAIAKVTSYNSGWGYVTLNAGSENNLTQGRELAVRRGGEVLGLVKISAIYENDSEAELIGRWRRDLEVPRPEAGDDLLPYPLF